ncbi:MAG TPA: polysaccharide deacetylase family protein [Alphaproteobacteria bacterium]|nr:polysaccharide deacetylase family protein [Alphaproteobacteria bacterium]
MNFGEEQEMPIAPEALRRQRRLALYALSVLSLSFAGLSLFGTAAARAADSAVILMYQRFDEPTQPDSISTKSFQAHLTELSDARYHVMSLPDVIAAFRSHTPLPDRTVVITLDDAYQSADEHAIPLLEQHHFPYTLFVTTDRVDESGPDYMTWDEIRAAAEQGATIGNHGARPFHMVEMSEDANRDNITRGSMRIAKETGAKPTLFAYPYGEFDNADQALLGAMGYAGAVSQYSGVATADPTPFDLPRFSLVEAYSGMDRFRMIANALPLPVADLLPGDPKLADNPPPLGFTLTQKVSGADALTCTPSVAGGKADVEHLGNRVEVRFDKPFPEGNGRVTCTTRTADDRLRWLGVPVYVPRK